MRSRGNIFMMIHDVTCQGWMWRIQPTGCAKITPKSIPLTNGFVHSWGQELMTKAPPWPHNPQHTPFNVVCRDYSSLTFRRPSQRLNSSSVVLLLLAWVRWDGRWCLGCSHSAPFLWAVQECQLIASWCLGLLCLILSGCFPNAWIEKVIRKGLWLSPFSQSLCSSQPPFYVCQERKLPWSLSI